MVKLRNSHEEDAVDELSGRAGEAELVEVPVDVEEAVRRAKDQPLYGERAQTGRTWSRAPTTRRRAS